MCAHTCTNVPDILFVEIKRRSRCWQISSERMGLFAVQHTSLTRWNRGAADHLHPPADGETQTLRQCVSLQRFICMNQLWLCLFRPHTSQRNIRSQFGNSRRGTWNAAWRRSPCGCFLTLRGRWRSNPAEEDWPEDSHPADEGKERVSVTKGGLVSQW